MSRLYLTPTPNATADSAQDNVSSAIQQTGLINIGGAATENIATENVDLRLRGRVQYGPLLNEKVARELESLAESQYTALPLVDDNTTGAVKRKRGYYELESTDVTPAHPVSESLYEYELRLTQKGTSEDTLRAVSTNIEPIDTALTTGSPAEIAIPAAATRPRWYSQATGAEPATPTRTEAAEFGNVAFFDPASTTIDNPTLIYQLQFESDGATDVRLYDDRNTTKFATTSNGEEISVWTHAYHAGYQFDGDPVIDTGRLRLRFNTAEADISASEYNNTTGVWESVALSPGDLVLNDYSFEDIGPSRVRVWVEAYDTVDGTISTAYIVCQRGRAGVLILPPANAPLDSELTSWLASVALDDTTNPNTDQDTISRSEVSD